MEAADGRSHAAAHRAVNAQVLWRMLGRAWHRSCRRLGGGTKPGSASCSCSEFSRFWASDLFVELSRGGDEGLHAGGEEQGNGQPSRQKPQGLINSMQSIAGGSKRCIRHELDMQSYPGYACVNLRTHSSSAQAGVVRQRYARWRRWRPWRLPSQTYAFLDARAPDHARPPKELTAMTMPIYAAT